MTNLEIALESRELALKLQKNLQVLSKNYEPAWEEIMVEGKPVSNGEIQDILTVFANGIETDYLICHE